jgi:calcineurin-like phosphoesterase family protein
LTFRSKYGILTRGQVKLSSFCIKEVVINTWITSDWHINHHNIIGLTGRPFKSTEEMNTTILNNINAVVKTDDILYVLGDCFFDTSKIEAQYFLNMIKCKNIILIKGNHCRDPNYMMTLGFSAVVQEAKILIAKEMVTLSHYPFKHKWYRTVWNWIRGRYKKDNPHFRRPEDHGGYLVHGHVHDDVKFNGRMINVCLEAWKYKPVPLQAIADYIIRHKKGEFK